MKFVLISFPSARLDNAGPNAFVMWGFTDKYSWTNYTFSGSGAPLVFNENYQPKLAYYALIEILLEKISPKSKLTCESAH
ncbi:MAG: endo-1,4-beta-xylanase [Candidatus Jordarchaeales archaeon]